MANLIPPDAKKAIIYEYWIRVFTVWFVMIGLAFIVVSLLKAPTFVLVQSQLNSFSGAYDGAREKEEAFTEAQQTIVDANDLSVLLTEFSTTIESSELIKILDDLAGSDVRISDFSFKRSADVLDSITVTGLADTRVSLAGFSDNIESHPLFDNAELPISNLAKDKDITFNIEITPAPPK